MKSSVKKETQDINTPLASMPVSNVVWIHRDHLKANNYNPNKVAAPELRLLKRSIMEDGWTQPIVVLEDNTIIDGFHRWTVSGHKEIYNLTDGWVPCVKVAMDKTHRMMSTIRHNRARGTHGVLPMAEIVKAMVDDGVSVPEIMERLGMEDEEVIRLANRVGLPVRMESQDFGKAWVPDDGK